MKAIISISIILLATSCAAPTEQQAPKPCPKVKIIYDRFDTSVANVEIYNQIQKTYKF